MSGLRYRVLATLQAARIAAVPVLASSSAASGPKGLDWPVDIVGRTAATGAVPVVGGDVILDSALGARILGGDEILAHLGRRLKLRRAVFVTDVDGLFLDGRRVDRLNGKSLQRVMRTVSRGRDATGGMRGKLSMIHDLVEAGVGVDIVNGLRPGRLEALLGAGKSVGTRIDPS
jgi:isopentenyl phosphate kinase